MRMATAGACAKTTTQKMCLMTRMMRHPSAGAAPGAARWRVKAASVAARAASGAAGGAASAAARAAARRACPRIPRSPRGAEPGATAARGVTAGRSAGARSGARPARSRQTPSATTRRGTGRPRPPAGSGQRWHASPALMGSGTLDTGAAPREAGAAARADVAHRPCALQPGGAAAAAGTFRREGRASREEAATRVPNFASCISWASAGRWLARINTWKGRKLTVFWRRCNGHRATSGLTACAGAASSSTRSPEAAGPARRA
mmetsp:Transcript_78310/g.221452  ORF Transcript_78310/g.221452 Transcript_78310/m.221452 type:complete len:262 (+) Transcript_78310:590-1375(+)